MHKIKFGVIGCGHIGKRHASMVQQNDECELIALCDAAQKDSLGLEGLDVPFYATPEEMLANEKLDGLVASQPFTRHGVLLPEILKARVPVFTEKPARGKRRGRSGDPVGP